MKPYPHQNEVQSKLQHMAILGGGFLCDDMGLGKTFTMSIFLTSTIKWRPSLIVCPYSLISTWKHWLQIAGCPQDRILIYHGAGRNVMRANMGTKKFEYSFVVTTYSVLSRNELSRYMWDKIVLDESHTIKNGLKSKPPKCCKAAFELIEKSTSRFCITGTPFNNRIEDLASQAFFIGVEPYNDKKWWQENSEDRGVINEWRSIFMIRRTKEDLNIIPPPIVTDVFVEPTSTEQRLISLLRSQAEEEFNNWKLAKQNGDNLERIRLQGKILGLIQKLRIVSDCFYSGNDIDTLDIPQVVIDCKKVERIIDDIDLLVTQDANNGLVVFSQFTSFLEILYAVIDETLPGIEVSFFTGKMDHQERDKIVEKFNTQRNQRVILVSLMAGGCGLSLHLGSSTLMLCEPYYNPFQEFQAMDRVNRLGQKHQVNVYRYNSTNSVESWIQKLKEKKLCQAEIISLVDSQNVSEDFNFSDIDKLFQQHVSFESDKGKRSNMEQVEIQEKSKKSGKKIKMPKAKGKTKLYSSNKSVTTNIVRSHFLQTLNSDDEDDDDIPIVDIDAIKSKFKY